MPADPPPEPAPDRAGARARIVAWGRPRVLLVGTAFLAGFALGALGTAALATLSGARPASTQVFATGALVLGFGVLGWSGSAIAGRAVEEMQTYLDTGTNWSETDSRRAMARISGVGAGLMVAVVAVTPLL